MIRIICTTEVEKDGIMKCLLESENCPLSPKDFPLCPESYSCGECIKNNIIFEISEENK